MIDWAQVRSATGRGIKVMVVDSGVEVSHPVFGGIEIPSFQTTDSSVPPFVRVEKVSPGRDLFGHGTAVAGLVHRLAPEAEIRSLQVLGSDNSASARSVIDALSWAADEGCDVINCSFGTQEALTQLPGGQAYNIVEAYRNVISKITRKGAIVVAAGSNLSTLVTEYPSSFPSVIGVTGAQLEDLALVRRPGEVIEFEASGTNVKVPWSGGIYKTMSGSSLAAPQVSALVALIKQLHPEWNQHEMRVALYRLAGESAR